MALVTDKKESLKIFEKVAADNMSVGIFCTASHWNTEAILIAAQRIAEKYGYDNVPVVVASTFTYQHMPQGKEIFILSEPGGGYQISK